MQVARKLCGALAFCLLIFSGDGAKADSAAGKQGAIATVHALASEAGLRAMRRGGNAVDAAVAAGLTLGVVDGFNSGIGGGCFILIRRANGRIVAIDGRETAPATATRDMYLRDGKADPQLSQTGALAVGVPGALAAYEQASRLYGKLPFREIIEAAAKIAEDGFQIDPGYFARLNSVVGDLRRFDSAREIFLTQNGDARPVGDWLKQADLAKTYRAIGEQGVDWFYRGAFARDNETWMRSHGGLFTASDFAKYSAKSREPIRTTYRGCEIIGFPPPSSGGVHVAQILNILEHFDLQSMGASSADFVHVVTEAMKLAFADRAHWLGDPDFVPVPRGLVAKNYAAKLARQVRLARASLVSDHGEPERAQQDVFGKHTTHFSAADADGNWVACTATINTTYGSKVVVPGTGVVLNNEMDDFSAQPGAANFFGLVGAEANAIAPGKRPLSSMSPTIVLKRGKPILSVGAAGGPTIISQTLLTIVYTIDFGMDLESALATARFHHQWKPDELMIEKKIGDEVLRELERRGHKLKIVNSLGAAQAVATDPRGKALVGAHDPRLHGKAAAW
ncbi:MAG: gamma-glutamyltransferase [Verrucomicrobia bacterium]|nr:gamma-glutamyltransferase [Verrucomicrobiota bacterium]